MLKKTIAIAMSGLVLTPCLASCENILPEYPSFENDEKMARTQDITTDPYRIYFTTADDVITTKKHVTTSTTTTTATTTKLETTATTTTTAYFAKGELETIPEIVATTVETTITATPVETVVTTVPAAVEDVVVQTEPIDVVEISATTTIPVCQNHIESYTIIMGDCLSNIAQKYDCSQELIQQSNPQVTDWNIIVPGDVISIPVNDGGVTYCEEQYVIQPEDYLFKIAEKTGASSDEIISANPYVDWNNLQIGDSIAIPTRIEVVENQPSAIPNWFEPVITESVAEYTETQVAVEVAVETTCVEDTLVVETTAVEVTTTSETTEANVETTTTMTTQKPKTTISKSKRSKVAARLPIVSLAETNLTAATEANSMMLELNSAVVDENSMMPETVSMETEVNSIMPEVNAMAGEVTSTEMIVVEEIAETEEANVPNTMDNTSIPIGYYSSNLPEDILNEVRKQQLKYPGMNIGVGIYSLDGTISYTFNADQEMAAGCTVKAAYALYVLKECEKQNINIWETYLIYEEGMTNTGSGDIQYEHCYGDELSIAVLLEKLLRISDNTAYNILCSKFELEDFQTFLWSINGQNLYGVQYGVASVEQRKNEWLSIYNYVNSDSQYAETLRSFITNSPYCYLCEGMSGWHEFMHKSGWADASLLYTCAADAAVVDNNYLLVVITQDYETGIAHTDTVKSIGYVVEQYANNNGGCIF